MVVWVDDICTVDMVTISFAWPHAAAGIRWTHAEDEDSFLDLDLRDFLNWS